MLPGWKLVFSVILLHSNCVREDTYVKTSVPHPAVSVKRRGPRSRAGFIAAPQLADIDMDIPRTITATMAGISSEGAGVFLFSSKHRMHSNSMPVPTT